MRHDILLIPLRTLAIVSLSCVAASLYALENTVLPLWENGALALKAGETKQKSSREEV